MTRWRPDGARIGLLLTGVLLTAIANEYAQAAWLGAASSLLAAATVAVAVVRGDRSQRIFALIGLGLVAWSAAALPGWRAATATALGRGGLVIALFTALTCLRGAAMRSPGIIACGRFLARQPPGRRYVALSIGGHLFGLVLMYGAIALLGSLAAESTRGDPDPRLGAQRTRRMMVAIQRGLASTLCWSPLGFSMIITLAVVPGARWSEAVAWCLISAALLLVGGWALDTAFKPRLKVPPAVRPPETERWLTALRPLLVLLAVVMAGVAALWKLTGVEIIGAVMTVVPLAAILWVALQPPAAGDSRLRSSGRHVAWFVGQELPAYRGQVVLLFMAGFIGSLGAALLVPMARAQGFDLSAVSPMLLLAAMVWVIPLTGQIGMNPILAVSLLVPLLPAPEAMGLSPVPLVVAITGGWALSATTSPFTASVLLAASIGGVSPQRAGIGWNGVYTLVMGSVMTAWAVLLAAML